MRTFINNNKTFIQRANIFKLSSKLEVCIGITVFFFFLYSHQTETDQKMCA